MVLRDTDFPPLSGGGVNIDRRIPLWGILSLIGAIGLQAVLVWNGQQLQGQKMDALALQFHELASELKDLNGQISVKASTDNEQTLRINELSRRLLILESRSDTRR